MRELMRRVLDRPPPPAPDALVIVLVQAEREILEDTAPPLTLAQARQEGIALKRARTVPVSMGTTAALSSLRPGECLELAGSPYKLSNVRVLVFCDLARVVIGGIFMGSDLMTAGLGPCPMATAVRWDPGVKVRVQVQARP